MLKKYDALAAHIGRDGNVACVTWQHANRCSCRNAMAECMLVTDGRDEDVRRSDIIAPSSRSSGASILDFVDDYF
jgi:hypothetical protein